MFYLKMYYKVLFKKPLATGMWLAGLAIVFFSFLGKAQINKVLTLEAGPQNHRPYFFAVMPKKVNAEYVKRKLLDLPGVDNVNVMAEESIIGHVKSVLESTQLDWDQGMIDLNYAGLKVFLSPDLKPRSQSLIRNYLTRIAGEKDVTLGAVKKPTQKKSKVKLGEIFSHFVNYLPLVGVFLLTLSLWSVRAELGRESFIVETYQRRSQVFERGVAFAQAPLITILAFFAYFYGLPGVVGLVIFSMSLVVILGLGKKSRTWS